MQLSALPHVIGYYMNKFFYTEDDPYKFRAPRKLNTHLPGQGNDIDGYRMSKIITVEAEHARAAAAAAAPAAPIVAAGVKRPRDEDLEVVQPLVVKTPRLDRAYFGLRRRASPARLATRAA